MADCKLYFDIGNTNCKVGVSIDDNTPEVYSFAGDDRSTADQLGLFLLDILRHKDIRAQDVRACVGSSVVPALGALLRFTCERYLNLSLLLTPEDIPIPLENRYPRKYEVGADRLVGAYAARKLFPDAASIISVDFGTATTFDCVEGNSYLGGLICPGIQSSAGALATRTAKLPSISLEIESTEVLPCVSTVTSLNHGFVFGFAAMTEGLVARLAKNMSGRTIIVGTGGFAPVIARVTDCFNVVRPNLLIEGLQILYKEFDEVMEKYNK